MSIDIQPTTPRLRPRGADPTTWVYLADLTLSAEEIDDAEKFARTYRMDRVGRLGLIECAKFRRYFAGMCIATRITPRGTVVLMADESFTPEFEDFLCNLPPELVGKVSTDCLREQDESMMDIGGQHEVVP